MSQREAALNLEWTPWDNLEWGANLPPIPGYPGTRYDGNVYAVVEPSAINGDAYGFHLHISINADDNIVLDNRDFDIPDGTADEMMAAVDDLSLRDIADMLDDMGYDPIDNPTASRHASKRTAALDLDWYYLQQNGFWHADLPTIPGYTYQTAHPSANVLPVYSATGRRKDEWKLQMGFDTIVDGGVTLTNNSFGIPNTETAEEMMQAVDNLSVEEISQTLSDCGYYAYFEDEPEYHHDGYWNTLSGEWVGSHRKDAHAHHATRRQARLNRPWYDELDDVEALVDAFEHPTSASASRHTVSRKGHKMIRKATNRTANLNLDWSEQPGGFYLAYLPSLPGYPSNPYEPNSVIVDTVDYESVNDEGVYDPDAGGWSFRMLLHANSEEMASLYPYTFTNSEEPFATAQEAMQFVDNLTLEDISQVLDDLDYLPLLDENGDWVTASLQASRKPRHATRRKRTLA